MTIPYGRKKAVSTCFRQFIDVGASKQSFWIKNSEPLFALFERQCRKIAVNRERADNWISKRLVGVFRISFCELPPGGTKEMRK